MAIAGMGTDIVDIQRIEAQLLRSQRLAERVLTEDEMKLFSAHLHPARYLAKRFAAKEAAVKALGTGIGNGIGWQQITITNDEFGAPNLVLSGEFLARCEARGITRTFVSISDEQSYAVATVILETSD